MDRPTERAGRKAAGAGLLTLVAACAVMQEPPGGPPDFAAPVLLSVTPDSGVVAEALREPVVFQFDEVIAEGSGGGLERLFDISPRPDRLDVRWRRQAITVAPAGGWRPGLVYHVTLSPGITDLRNNRLGEGKRIVFTTGGPIPETEINGQVVDWESHRIAARAVIEATLLPDSLVYSTMTDSTGQFALGAVPQGNYLLIAAVDGNNNGRRDPREPFDSATVTLDSTLTRTMWAFLQDTIGPGIAQSTVLDSVTVRIRFNQKLAPGEPDDSVARVWILPDTVPVALVALWNEVTYDSLTAAEQAAADSVAAQDTTVADSVAARPAAQQPAGRTQTQRTPRPTAGGADTSSVSPDSAAAALLLRQRPKLENAWVIRLAEPMSPGSRYLVETRAMNVNGLVRVAVGVVIVPERREAQ